MKQWLKRLFKKENLEETPTFPNLVFQRELLNREPLNREPLQREPLQIEADETALPYWLSNEDNLRDEGVIYGLSNTDPSEKVNAVSAIFKRKTAPLTQAKEELSEKIGELNLLMEKTNGKMEALNTKITLANEAELKEEQIARVLVGLSLSIAICAANYFTIREGLNFGLGAKSPWISWGVFLVGMFSLYFSTSALHSSERITWRRALEEFGMPLAASLFVYVQTVEHMPWYKSLAFFGFIFFLFLISGKLLLGNISQLRKEFYIFTSNNELKADKISAETTWLDKQNGLEKEMERIRLEKWDIVKQMNKIEAQISGINSEAETAINLFMSEYHLAQQFKDKSKKLLSNERGL